MEYQSNARFLGLPLVHIAFGTVIDGRYQRGIAIGWIAIGDIALGSLFSCGGIALGAISIGGLSFGLLAVGGLALGGIAIGGLSLGAIAVGGTALAWHAALGGIAIAHEYAIGGLAFAPHMISPPSPDSASPWPIPHAPFRWSDAVLLLVIVGVMLVIARVVQVRRKELSSIPKRS